MLSAAALLLPRFGLTAGVELFPASSAESLSGGGRLPADRGPVEPDDESRDWTTASQDCADEKSPVQNELSTTTATSAPPVSSQPKAFWAWAISIGAVLGSAANSFTDGPNERFHFTNKNGFGSLRFAGGADLVSHFVDYGIVAKEFMIVYSKLGYSETHSRILASSVAWFTNFVTELGDGRGHYGFNYEDIVAGTLGIGATALISATHSGDLVGFRIGYLIPHANLCCTGVGQGRSYSNEIYTGDLKIVGLSRRLGFNPGPARYLYFSVTYGTKGYPEADVPLRERQVGFEFGINFGQIARDLGLREDSWVGIAAYLFLDNFRIPYTQIGFYYDMNHHRWHGPGVGVSYGSH
jgi:hypothetical protein